MVDHRRGRVRVLSLLLLFGVSGALRGSPVADFQARLAQTAWCLAQVEAILRAQPESSVPVQTPEALVSYLGLVSENITALAAFGSAQVSDEQRRVIAEGLRISARIVRDEVSLANNRGLTSAAAALSVLESNCRAQLASP